ncbi:MAG TPA: AbrB/MazE/SpoVT family DNA-binding domain-containing protein [Bacilli bacterium]
MIQVTTKVSSKGQIVVPMEIRKQFHIQEGDSLKFTINESEEIKVEILKRNSIMDLFGSVQAKGDTQDFEKVRRETSEDRIDQRNEKMY